jgi:glycine/betaine/sarcosine/D-proline reductase family selenoprotein B
MTRFIHKIALSEDIGSASEEGYIPRGMRVVTTAESSGIDRAIQMLLDQHSARPFVTEIPIEKLDVIPVPPPITNLTEATLALVCEAGVVPLGNPDGFKNHRNTQWKKYPITNFSTMKDSKWEVRHAGFDVSFMAENPNYAVPLDVVRDMERKGVFSRLYPYYYATCGNNALIAEMARIGTEMAFDIKKEKIEGVLLVST